MQAKSVRSSMFKMLAQIPDQSIFLFEFYIVQCPKGFNIQSEVLP